MKFTPWYLAALAPIAVAGCSGALLGHVAVLAIAIGIFVGTLRSVGRRRPPRPAELSRRSRSFTRRSRRRFRPRSLRRSRSSRIRVRTRRRDTEDSVMSIRTLALVVGICATGLAASACSSPGFSSHGAPPPESHSTSGATTGFTTRGMPAVDAAVVFARLGPLDVVRSAAARSSSSSGSGSGSSSKAAAAVMAAARARGPATPSASASFGPAPSPNPLYASASAHALSQAGPDAARRIAYVGAGRRRWRRVNA